MQPTTLLPRGRFAALSLLFLVLLFLLPSATLADATPSATPTVSKPTVAAPLPYLDQLPPLVDRQLFFDDPEITNSQFSPDGKFLTFLKPYEGVQNVWIKGLNEGWDAARPLTARAVGAGLLLERRLEVAALCAGQGRQ